jgi:hypothetical protein
MNKIVQLGKKLQPSTIIGLLLGLNIFWVGILNSFGTYFERAAGAPLLDLQNTQGILTTAAAQALISGYSEAARALYWPFFIMDNILPPLVFGMFSLLWVLLLRKNARSWAKRFLACPLLLLPLGVGFFDWWENLAFLNAIMTAPGSDVSQMLQIGLFFVWLKAICLYATFVLTASLLVYRAVTALMRLLPAWCKPTLS